MKRKLTNLTMRLYKERSKTLMRTILHFIKTGELNEKLREIYIYI